MKIEKIVGAYHMPNPVFPGDWRGEQKGKVRRIHYERKSNNC
jgi:hypothetical protein